MAKSIKSSPSLESQFEMLNEIIKQLESGELSLEDALKEFESGVNLLKYCQKTLEQAEQKIKELTEEVTP